MGVRNRKAIPTDISKKLWIKAGGRCEYEGCNKLLYRDSLTEQDMNTAYIAHIISAREDGPRGDPTRSSILEFELTNLMLLCDECHRRIDREQLKEHPEDRLVKMKKEHEDRIELVTGITANKKSHIVVYTAKVGSHEVNVSYKQAADAMIPNRFPVIDRTFYLGIKNTIEQDHDPEFWNQQYKQLEGSFNKLIQPLLGHDPVQDFSVFAFAPQPLLIKLGVLFSDKYSINVFQFHRYDSSWKWGDNSDIKDFELIEPSNKSGVPALAFSLSGVIDKCEVKSILGDDCSIWEITIEKPYNDFLKTKEMLSKFKQITRHAIEKIKLHHGCTPLHIFPAMPVSASVETGRLWMAKADMPLIIYDKNTAVNGFMKTFEIRNSI